MRRAGSIRGRRQFDALSVPEREAHLRALEAVNLMRREVLSLARAAERAETTTATVLAYASEALDREPGGRWRAKRGDRLFARMSVQTVQGPMLVETRGSGARSTIGEHNAAVAHYLATGDASRLARFQGKRVGGHLLETDPDVLRFWSIRQPPSDDRIYDVGR
jgi:hypothetical protein